MVIILASNRADMIDPAILRPGRIDRKIKVSRPTKKGSEEIYRIYINPNLPLDPQLLKESGDDRQKGGRYDHREGHRRAIQPARRQPLPRSHAP